MTKSIEYKAARVSFTDKEIEELRLEALEHKGGEDGTTGVFDPGYKAEEHQPGSFSYHEGFDRAFTTMNIVEANLLDHTAILLDPVAHKLAYEAHAALFNLYQHMGSKHL